jgi:hypothetical protein
MVTLYVDIPGESAGLRRHHEADHVIRWRAVNDESMNRVRGGVIVMDIYGRSTLSENELSLPGALTWSVCAA